MPVFYGMMLANQLAGGAMMQVDGKIDGANATAYAARFGARYRVAVFNKDAVKGVDVSIRVPGKARRATAWRLRAPALDATEGVTLAGAEIRDGEWRPKDVEAVEVRDGAARIRVPASSAVLVFLG